MSFVKDMVERPHSVLTRNFEFWNFLLDSYEGGPEYTDASVRKKSNSKFSEVSVYANGKRIDNKRLSNLFEHSKERPEDYRIRVDMSFYYNFCAPIIDIYTDHLFRFPVIDDFGSIQQGVELQQDNVDRRESSIHEYRREMADLCQIYGHCFVIVDSPQAEAEIFSLEDKIVNGMFPYFSTVHPQNVINWALDRFGRPFWVLIREISDANDDPMEYDSERLMRTNYRLWTKEEWILFDEGYNEIERGAHGLNQVPIVPVYNQPSKKEKAFLGISAIADIAFIARDVYNLSSELRQIIRDQTFNILALQGEGDDFNDVTIGTNKGLIYPRETNPPQYISPDKGPAEVIQKQIDTQISKIFQLARLEGGSASFSGQSAVEQSGVSKAWDFNQTNATLARKAGNLEDAEMKMWALWANWEGKEFDGMISYPREFSVKSINEELEEAEKLIKLNVSNEFQKEVKKAIVKKKFPRLPEDKEEEIMQEIESQVQTGQGQRIADRLPGLFNRNGDRAGNNGGLLNGRPTTTN